MRILQVLPHLSKGGAERIVIELSNALIDEGHNVTLLLAMQVDPVLNQQYLSEFVLVETVSSRKKNRLLTYLLLPIWVIKNRKLLRTYDVVHCHLTYGLVFGFIFSIFRKIDRRVHVRLIATCHAVGTGVTRAHMMINKRLSVFFDVFALMAMDDEWRRFVARKNVENIKFVTNGISPFKVSKSNLDLKNVQRKKIDLATQKKVLTIGTISRLQSERKPWLFLQVFAEVRRLVDFEVHFILGGEGPERESLKKLAEQLQLSKNLTMLGLIQDPAALLVNLDLYVTLNVEETTGIAGLEAVFAGIPAVGIQLSQEYSNGQEDWIWSDKNPQVVGREIAKYLSSPKLLQAIAKSQFSFANEKYSLNRMLGDYLSLYKPSK